MKRLREHGRYPSFRGVPSAPMKSRWYQRVMVWVLLHSSRAWGVKKKKEHQRCSFKFYLNYPNT